MYFAALFNLGALVFTNVFSSFLVNLYFYEFKAISICIYNCINMCIKFFETFISLTAEV